MISNDICQKASALSNLLWVPDRCFLTPTFLVISSPISTATLLASITS
ncbi:dam [Salmonella enterica subsp. enterica serovar Heidelberg str. B182]|nr:dam [Salmonella enterica subsp. enterica serovar Heidelberg str. B182]